MHVNKNPFSQTRQFGAQKAQFNGGGQKPQFGQSGQGSTNPFLQGQGVTPFNVNSSKVPAINGVQSHALAQFAGQNFNLNCPKPEAGKGTRLCVSV